MGGVAKGVGSAIGLNRAGKGADRFQDAVQFSPFDVTGPQGSATFTDGKLNLELSPEMQQFADLFQDRSLGLFGDAEAFDVEAQSRDQLDMLRRLMAPQEEQQRLGMENRLFSQGRLGSTGGSQQFADLLQGQGQNDLQRTLQSVQMGRDEQARLFSQANTLFGNLSNLNQSLLPMGELGGNLGSQQSSANAAAYQPQLEQAREEGRAIADFFGALGGGMPGGGGAEGLFGPTAAMGAGPMSGFSTSAIAAGIPQMLPAAASSGGIAAMSDRRLKRDVSHVGKTPGGFNVYRFRYVGGDDWFEGVMADEVEPVLPDAVFEVAGYKAVDYARIT